jgi:hypothetical protein
MPKVFKSAWSTQLNIEYKRIWRMRQEYFTVYEEYANQPKNERIAANFRPKSEKYSDPKSPYRA